MCVCVCVYLPLDALVMARTEGGDDTNAPRVAVKPLPTHTSLTGAAAVDKRGGVNVPAAPLAQRQLIQRAPPPLLAVRTCCRKRKRRRGGAKGSETIGEDKKKLVEYRNLHVKQSNMKHE